MQTAMKWWRIITTCDSHVTIMSTFCRGTIQARAITYPPSPLPHERPRGRHGGRSFARSKYCLIIWQIWRSLVCWQLARRSQQTREKKKKRILSGGSQRQMRHHAATQKSASLQVWQKKAISRLALTSDARVTMWQRGSQIKSENKLATALVRSRLIITCVQKKMTKGNLLPRTKVYVHPTKMLITPKVWPHEGHQSIQCSVLLFWGWMTAATGFGNDTYKIWIYLRMTCHRTRYQHTKQ